MRITLFRNMRGLIHGSDPKRIGCDKPGTLKIGKTEVKISSEENEVMPMLMHGCTGEHEATYTTADGAVYHLEKVSVRGGWITPPSPTTVEIMELRCRADAAEAKCEALGERIRELSKIFDTNALNFLIK